MVTKQQTTIDKQSSWVFITSTVYIPRMTGYKEPQYSDKSSNHTVWIELK